MKFTVNADKLRAALQALANPPGESSQQLDSLAVMITAEGFDGVTLRRTTPLAMLETALEAEVGDDGACAANYGVLLNAVGDLDGELEFELKGGDLWASAGKDVSRVACLEESEIPPRPNYPETSADFEFASGDLKSWLAATLPAASKNEAEPAFRGVCFREQLGQVTVFGLDKRRFHLRFCGLFDGTVCPEGQNDAGVLLPPETAQTIIRLLPPESATVQIGFSKRAVVYACGATKALLPIAETTPPSVLKFVPWDDKAGKAECAAVVDREKFLKATRAASALGFGESRVVTLEFGNGALVVEGDTEKGAAKRRFTEAEVTGKTDRVVRISGAFLGELLEAANKPQIKVELIAGQPMVVIRDEDQILAGMLVRDHKTNVG